MPDRTKDLHRAAQLLDRAPYVFARSMAANPHCYTLRRKWADDKDFCFVVQTIRLYGYQSWFQGWAYTQLDLNGWTYWTMGDPVASTILINRKSTQYENAWDYVADYYDEAHAAEAGVEQNSAMMRQVPDLTGDVLDIECGLGGLLRHFQPDPDRYTGIDPSQALLRKLAAAAPAYEPCLRRCAMSDFYPDQRYDIFTAMSGRASRLTAENLEQIQHLARSNATLIAVTYADPEVGALGMTERLSGFAEVLPNHLPRLLGEDRATTIEAGGYQLYVVPVDQIRSHPSE